MSSPNRRILVISAIAVLALAIAFVLWITAPAGYVPIVMDGRQQLVEDPTMLTPAHLDRLEAVLKRYDEWYQRIDATHLRISRKLWRDRDLLWNYTTKAEDGVTAGG